MMGHLQAVEVLLNNEHVGVNIGATLDGGTPFSISSENLHFEVMRALVKYQHTDLSKGWCSDNWIHHFKLCNNTGAATQTILPSQPTQPGPGQLSNGTF